VHTNGQRNWDNLFTLPIVVAARTFEL
jgi:hypothetical protein